MPGVPALHVHRYGPPDGPPLLVLHGITNTGARYRRLAEAELPSARALVPDLRGHADSPWEPPWDVRRHVDDLLTLLDAEGLERVPVAGHSFGGLVAMALAAAAPERVERLALIDPAIGLDPARVLRESEESWNDQGWASVEEARADRRSQYSADARATVDEDIAGFLALGPDGRWRLRYCRSAIVVARSEMSRPAPSLAAWQGDVLLVTALRADYVMPALVEGLRREVGGRLSERAIDAGHMLAWEAPAELGAMLREWLA